MVNLSFIDLTLLVGQQKNHPAYKTFRFKARS